MAGLTLGLIITLIVVVIVLAAWIGLVFYTDAHPPRRREAPRHRATSRFAAPGRPRPVGVAAAYAAAVLAFASAAVSVYWAAGGTALLSTVGGTMEEIGRHGGLSAVTLGLAAAGLKAACGIMALALARPRGRGLPRRWLVCAALASAVLVCYGAVQVTVGALVLSGAVRPAGPVDWTALRWHVALWDAWFLAWGILLAAATMTSWRQFRRPVA